MNASLIEFEVRDWPQSLAWYRDRLGLTLIMLDEPKQFALFDAGTLRLSLKAGTPTPGGIRLFFEVQDLPEMLTRLIASGVAITSPMKSSPEGYRRAFTTDPDGYAIGFFDWDKSAPSIADHSATDQHQ